MGWVLIRDYKVPTTPIEDEEYLEQSSLHPGSKPPYPAPQGYAWVWEGEPIGQAKVAGMVPDPLKKYRP